MGLVNAVVPLAKLEEETMKWCREMLRALSIGAALLKDSVERGL